MCGFEGARSDQCDKCGNVLEPEKLLNPRSKVDGSTPELRETEHFYLDLSKLEPEVVNFLRQRSGYMRETVLGEILRDKRKPDFPFTTSTSSSFLRTISHSFSPPNANAPNKREQVGLAGTKFSLNPIPLSDRVVLSIRFIWSR